MKYFLILFFSIVMVYSCKPKKELTKEEPKEIVKQEKEEVEQSFEEDVLEKPSIESLSEEDLKNYHLIQDGLPQGTFAQIRRTSCFGRCPTFTLTVLYSGVVEYKGERNVDKIGLYRSKVDQKVLNDLLKKAEEANFFYLDYVYDNKKVTDLPSTITSVKKKYEMKTIISRIGEPNALRAFNKYFEQQFENLDWEKVEEH